MLEAGDGRIAITAIGVAVLLAGEAAGGGTAGGTGLAAGMAAMVWMSADVRGTAKESFSSIEQK